MGEPRQDGHAGHHRDRLAAAIQAQNRQNAAGSVGQPPIADGTDFQYPVNATGRLIDPEQFRNIVLRAQPDGSLLRLGDIGRVELGAQTTRTTRASTASRRRW